jgi:hypothetical protein
VARERNGSVALRAGVCFMSPARHWYEETGAAQWPSWRLVCAVAPVGELIGRSGNAAEVFS